MKLDETFYRSVSVLPIALAKDDTRGEVFVDGVQGLACWVKPIRWIAEDRCSRLFLSVWTL